MITLRRLNLRHVLRPPPYTLRHFSDAPPGKTDPEPSFSSYFTEVRANLKREPPPQNRLQSPHKPFSFAKSPQTPPPSKGSYFEEIGRNLAEFRSRSAPPPPTNDNESDNSPNNSGKNLPNGRPFDALRENLRRIRPEAKNGSDQYPSSFRDSLSPKPGQSDGLPSSLWKEKTAGDGSKMRGFMREYKYSEMGEKLKMLRPETKKGKWFSLHELNDRLVKLREMEEMERQSIVPGIYKDLKETVVKLAYSEEEKKMKKTMQKLEILDQLGLGGTPTYMMSEPKDDLVEKYFHPDNMSSSEKLKLELKRVRDEFKMSESDCGSARVQVAQLTTKIHHLSSLLHKKDKHSRRGLLAMVQRRKKLLKYLRRSDWDSYCLVLSKLSLRDVTDIKN